MIKIDTKAVKEDLPEITVKFRLCQIHRFLPTCPQCKKIR